MNPQRLLQHFDTISEAPDAVAKLRRFILDLAVRGKLVEQDSGDEPASKLLARIRSEKVRRIESGELRKAKSRVELVASSLPFPLPPKWCWSQLSEIGVLNPRVVSCDLSVGCSSGVDPEDWRCEPTIPPGAPDEHA